MISFNVPPVTGGVKAHITIETNYLQEITNDDIRKLSLVLDSVY